MQLDFLDNPSKTPEQVSAGFPNKMVILDIETTGGKATYHRIIEIGLLIVDDGKLIERWQSFINPETSLPPFIQKLTGIQPSMIDDAPIFASVANLCLISSKGVHWSLIMRALIMAFLKNEFERVGISYNTKPCAQLSLVATSIRSLSTMVCLPLLSVFNLP